MTLKTRVVGFLQYAQGDDVQTYLQRWLAQSLRQTDGLFDPVSGHNHNGTGSNGPTVAGGGGITMLWRGAWSSATSYSKNDGVSYQGSSYIALNNVTSSTPPPSDPTNWGVLAQAGATGPQGPTGPQGATGPQGSTGATGPQGPTGATGSQGPAGAAATIAVGTTTTGAAGSSATVSNSGTSSAAVFNFTIPQGIQGATGATGSQGPQGATGSQGPAGQGVPTGGATGQVLAKTSATDYATAWQTPAAPTWG